MRNQFRKARRGLVAGVVMGAWMIAAPALQAAGESNVRSEHGMHIVSFATAHGSVEAYFPDDVLLGEKFGFRIVTKPAGDTLQETMTNRMMLERTSLNVGGQRTPLTEPWGLGYISYFGSYQLDLGPSLDVQLEMPGSRPIAANVSTDGSTAQWPVFPTIGLLGEPFQVPVNGGSWFGFPGEIQLGDCKAEALAVSERKAVAVCGNMQPGLSELVVRHGGQVERGPFRTVVAQVRIGTQFGPVGQRTIPVEIVALGLSGLQQPIEITIGGAAGLSPSTGLIQPSQVQPGGFAMTRHMWSGAGGPGTTVTVTSVRLKPEFTCCESNIAVTKGEARARKTERKKDKTTVTVDYYLKLTWDCADKRKQDCLAFYNVSVAGSSWQEFNAATATWQDVPRASITETIIPAGPLKEKCDGKSHTGIWGFRYRAEILSTNQLRNPKLVFNLDSQVVNGKVKGKSYTWQTSITDVSGTSEPKVKVETPVEKQTPQGGGQQPPRQPMTPGFVPGVFSTGRAGSL